MTFCAVYKCRTRYNLIQNKKCFLYLLISLLVLPRWCWYWSKVKQSWCMLMIVCWCCLSRCLSWCLWSTFEYRLNADVDISLWRMYLYNKFRLMFKFIHPSLQLWLIDWIVFYALSEIFQPYHGGLQLCLREIWPLKPRSRVTVIVDQ